jgi:hypothetical protein
MHEKESAMKGVVSRRDFVRVGAAASLGLLSGCGMILHPERRNQPPGGGLDWSVVALDTLGLVLFFLPGVIAFAVDFSTGAIYLPPPGYGSNALPTKGQQLVEVHVPPKELSQQRLEQVASQHAKRDVRLVVGKYVTAPLAKLDEFWPMRERLAGSHQSDA